LGYVDKRVNQIQKSIASIEVGIVAKELFYF